MKEREKISKEKLVGKISSLGILNWKKAQLENPSVLEIYYGKKIGKRPLRQELIRRDSDTKNYWLHWDSF